MTLPLIGIYNIMYGYFYVHCYIDPPPLFFLARLFMVIDHFVVEIIIKEKEDVETQSVQEDG